MSVETLSSTGPIAAAPQAVPAALSSPSFEFSQFSVISASDISAPSMDTFIPGENIGSYSREFSFAESVQPFESDLNGFDLLSAPKYEVYSEPILDYRVQPEELSEFIPEMPRLVAEDYSDSHINKSEIAANLAFAKVVAEDLLLAGFPKVRVKELIVIEPAVEAALHERGRLASVTEVQTRLQTEPEVKVEEVEEAVGTEVAIKEEDQVKERMVVDESEIKYQVDERAESAREKRTIEAIDILAARGEKITGAGVAALMPDQEDDKRVKSSIAQKGKDHSYQGKDSLLERYGLMGDLGTLEQAKRTLLKENYQIHPVQEGRGRPVSKMDVIRVIRMRMLSTVKRVAKVITKEVITTERVVREETVQNIQPSEAKVDPLSTNFEQNWKKGAVISLNNELNQQQEVIFAKRT